MSALPHFDGEYVAFSPFDREALRRLIRRAIGSGRPRMLEVGSWLGNGSTQEFIAAGVDLVCVDTWLGSPNVQRHQDIAAQFDVYGTFLRNTAGANVATMREPSLDAARRFADGSLDLVFIDGDHSYRAVRADIEAWRPKVRRGGILCGHDCELRPDAETLAELRLHLEVDALHRPGGDFAHIHPGPIIAVHELIGDRVHLFSEEVISLVDGQRGYSSVWWVEV